MGQLKAWIGGSDNAVFFGGAGVSTESGIPDFWSEDGLYYQQYQYPPGTIISHSFYTKSPEKFYRFYRNRMIFEDAKFNPAHPALVGLERQRKLKAAITQNIDGLHQVAGSREVLKLYGSIHQNYRIGCGKSHELGVVTKSDGVPKCSHGRMMKPDVMLYEEGLDQETLQKAVCYISHTDMLIVGGTSLTVYPAVGLTDYYGEQELVLINRTVTPMDSQAGLMINDKLGEMLRSVVGKL